MLAPSTPKRLAWTLVAFAFIWLLPVPAALASGGGTASSSVTADERVTPPAPSPAEIPVLQPPLVPELFGPALLPVDGGARVRSQPPPASPLPRGLLPLFASYAVLQALDVQSTLSAVTRGAVEQNAVMAPFVSRPAAFIAFKAGVTAATLLAAERLSKHHRVASYALMIALNSAYAVVVAHNYRVGQQLR